MWICVFLDESWLFDVVRGRSVARVVEKREEERKRSMEG
jgi:hypothetical protein